MICSSYKPLSYNCIGWTFYCNNKRNIFFDCFWYKGKLSLTPWRRVEECIWQPDGGHLSALRWGCSEPGYQPPVLVEQQAVWALGPARTLWRKLSCPCRESNRDFLIIPASDMQVPNKNVKYFYNVTVLENCIAPFTSKLIILVKPTLTKETRSFLKLSPLYKYSLYHPAFCKPLNYDSIQILLFFRHQLRTYNVQ